MCFTVRPKHLEVPAALPSPKKLSIPQGLLPVKPVVRKWKYTVLSIEILQVVQLHENDMLMSFFTVFRFSTHTQSIWWSAAWLWARWRKASFSRTASATFLMKGRTHCYMRGPLPSTQARPAAQNTQRLLSSMAPPHPPPPPPPRRMRRSQAQLLSELNTTLAHSQHSVIVSIHGETR